MSSEIHFNLDQSKIMSSGNGLTLYWILPALFDHGIEAIWKQPSPIGQSVALRVWEQEIAGCSDITGILLKRALNTLQSIKPFESIVGKGETPAFSPTPLP